jgi:hypothetical protein
LRPLPGLATEIYVAQSKSGFFQQRVEGAQRFEGHVLENEDFGSGHKPLSDRVFASAPQYL